MRFAVAKPRPCVPPPLWSVVESAYSIRALAPAWQYGSVFGIALGILVPRDLFHSRFGFQSFIKRLGLYQLLMLVAASYFFWLGWQAMRSQPPTETNEIEVTGFEAEVSARRAVVIGFFH